ncbi:MAG: TIGR02996 domain-containing protein [Myxococcales bacterium]|nr:TIGR02996 domain-containing protein [Myxococcales bacterium]
MDEQALLRQVLRHPGELGPLLVYADCLDLQGRASAAEMVRVLVALPALQPDHGHWHAMEQAFSRCLRQMSPTWLAQIDPARFGRRWPSDLPISMRPGQLRREIQDTVDRPWVVLGQAIDEARRNGAEFVAPFRNVNRRQRHQVVTLPPSVGQLVSLKRMRLYDSPLVRLPAEIGTCAELQTLDLLQSVRLSWFPHELTRCQLLQDFRVNNRVLFGNPMTCLAFPRLDPPDPERMVVARTLWGPALRRCATCDTEYDDRGLHRYWITARVATETVPLLANLCSAACVELLREETPGATTDPHRGGDTIRDLERSRSLR